MSRRSLLITVALFAVTLLSAIVATRFFVTLPAYEAPTDPVVTERPTAAIGTTLTPEAEEASRLVQEMIYEQASLAAEAHKAEMELTMDQAQDAIAGQFEDRESLAKYVSDVIGDGTLTYDELFQGTLLVGDYTAATVSMYGFLNAEHCIGQTDADLDFLNDQVYIISALAPQTLILHFGMYELEEDILQMQTGFIDRYAEIIRQIKRMTPGTKIVVSSIFPVTNEKQNSDQKYANRMIYNAALQTMCTDNGWQFLNNDTVVAQHADLFGSGGVYLSGEFYEDYWLQHIYVQSRNIKAVAQQQPIVLPTQAE